MSKFNVELVLSPSVAATLGKGPPLDFIDKANPPQRGDILRIKGQTFAVQLRLWDLDISPPTLKLKLEPQEIQ